MQINNTCRAFTRVCISDGTEKHYLIRFQYRVAAEASEQARPALGNSSIPAPALLRMGGAFVLPATLAPTPRTSIPNMRLPDRWAF